MADTPILTEDQKKALEHYGKKVDEPTGKTDAELAAEKKEAEEKALSEKAIADKKLVDDAEAEKLKNAPVAEKVQLTDEELMEEIAKRSGRSVKSWDELKPTATEEEKKKELEKKDSDKLTYGLKKGLFNKSQYEAYISDSKNPKDLVYSRELAAAKEADPEWDDDKEKEFKEEFESEFGLNLDTSSTKNKRGQRNLARIADSILKTEYASIYKLDEEFDKHENEVNSVESRKQKVLTAAPIYKADAEKVISKFSKLDMKFGEEEIEVPIPKEMTDALSKVMLDNNFSASQILKGYNVEELEEFGRQYLIGQNFQALSFEAAKRYREKHEKGVRGIPEGGKLQGEVDDSQLTENQQKAIGYFKGQPAPVSN